VTIVLTTHYIEEAEDMADRVGVISKGKIILVEEKATLMKKLGKKQMTLSLQQALARIPPGLEAHTLALNAEGTELKYTYDPRASQDAIASLLDDLQRAGIRLKDLQTSESSLEDIFVSLVEGAR
jgi:ABC-2 type transport system ATP-binding protein